MTESKEGSHACYLPTEDSHNFKCDTLGDKRSLEVARERALCFRTKRSHNTIIDQILSVLRGSNLNEDEDIEDITNAFIELVLECERTKFLQMKERTHELYETLLLRSLDVELYLNENGSTMFGKQEEIWKKWDNYTAKLLEQSQQRFHETENFTRNVLDSIQRASLCLDGSVKLKDEGLHSSISWVDLVYPRFRDELAGMSGDELLVCIIIKCIQAVLITNIFIAAMIFTRKRDRTIFAFIAVLFMISLLAFIDSPL